MGNKEKRTKKVVDKEETVTKPFYDENKPKKSVNHKKTFVSDLPEDKTAVTNKNDSAIKIKSKKRYSDQLQNVKATSSNELNDDDKSQVKIKGNKNKKKKLSGSVELTLVEHALDTNVITNKKGSVDRVTKKIKDEDPVKYKLDSLNEDEAEVKEEDIDKFCDELSEEDNKTYENWVQLFEDNFKKNKKSETYSPRFYFGLSTNT